MKKVILTLFAAVAICFGLVSCEHQTMITSEFTVYPGDWVKPNAADYYMCTVQWDDLTPDVTDYGMVNVYLLDGGRQNILPYVYPMEYIDDNGDAYWVPEEFRYDFRAGYLSIIIQSLDGYMPDLTGISPITFRVVALGD